MTRRFWTFSGRILLLTLVTMALVVALALALSALGMGPLLAGFLAMLLGVIAQVIAVQRVTRTLYRRIQALRFGAENLKDRDFSVQVTHGEDDEIGALIQVFNDATQALQSERHDLYQRELLLDTLMQTAPMAIVLTDQNQRIVFANRMATRMLGIEPGDRARPFGDLLQQCPRPLHRALALKQDTLVSIESDGRPEALHLSQRSFVLNTQPHTLILIRPMTREINREEIAVWKKIIRLVSHELNNSLAPISSLIHSAARVRHDPQRADQQDQIFERVQDRIGRLKSFLADYAAFARLPDPNPAVVDLDAFLGEIRDLYPFRQQLHLAPDLEVRFDVTQMQQVLINLIKNAIEAGSAAEDVEVSITSVPGHELLVSVRDRGCGIDASDLHRVLVPFYSKKEQGSGLGLALSREIVTGHGGHLTLHNREGGGLEVRCHLPESGSLGSNARG